MRIEKHDLAYEFPEYRDQIHQLKTTDQHFSNFSGEYHAVDHEVRRIEMEIEPTSDDYLENRKKRHLFLKDELYAILRASHSV